MGNEMGISFSVQWEWVGMGMENVILAPVG